MDKNYWDEYYKLHGGDKEISDPSSFAKFVLKNFFSERKFNIVELGSGNGRDAIFFACNDHSVIAIDQSTRVINIQKQKRVASKMLPFYYLFLYRIVYKTINEKKLLRH